MASPAILNQIGQQFLTVSTVAVGITRPPVTTGELRNEFGQLNRKTVSKMLVTVVDQPVRWRADGTAPTGTFEDNILAAGEKLTWMEPDMDYRGPIDQIRFIRDATATGDARLEIAMFTSVSWKELL